MVTSSKAATRAPGWLLPVGILKYPFRRAWKWRRTAAHAWLIIPLTYGP